MLYQAVRLADGSVVRIAEGEAGYLAILGTLSLPVVPVSYTHLDVYKRQV